MDDFRIAITFAAEEELAEAINWYEQQQAGLGNRFLQTVDDALERLAQNPYLYQEYGLGYEVIRWLHFPICSFTTSMS